MSIELRQLALELACKVHGTDRHDVGGTAEKFLQFLLQTDDHGKQGTVSDAVEIAELEDRCRQLEQLLEHQKDLTKQAQEQAASANQWMNDYAAMKEERDKLQQHVDTLQKENEELKSRGEDPAT